MTPIHHSKLKKGDLIYVQEVGLFEFDPPVIMRLAEVTSNKNGWLNYCTDKIGFGTNCSSGNFFLIERGYFL